VSQNDHSPHLLTQLPVEYLFTYRAELDAHVFDTGYGDTRMFTSIVSGSFEGPDLRGEIVPSPSSERALIRPDGVFVGDVKLVLVPVLG